MKLIKNSGNDRVVDALRQSLVPHSSLDVDGKRTQPPFPKTAKLKNKSEKCGVFFGADSRSFFDHLSPAFHHDFTIKKPSRITTFPQKPLLKWPPATFKKSCRQHHRKSRLGPERPPFLIPPQKRRSHANSNAAVRLPDTRHFAVEMHIEGIAAAMRTAP